MYCLHIPNQLPSTPTLAMLSLTGFEPAQIEYTETELYTVQRLGEPHPFSFVVYE